MGFIDNIMENLGLDGLAEGVKSKMIVVGFESAYFEGVKSILGFASDEISLRLKNEKLTIKGKDLSVKKFCEGDVIVCGRITAIERN